MLQLQNLPVYQTVMLRSMLKKGQSAEVQQVIDKGWTLLSAADTSRLVSHTMRHHKQEQCAAQRHLTNTQ